MSRSLALVLAGGLLSWAGCSEAQRQRPSGAGGESVGGAGVGGAGAGGAGVGGAGAGGAGEPIEAPLDEWTWVPFEGTACGNGTPAGIGINPHAGSGDLVVIVSGGGACWTDEMCNGPSPTSVHLDDTLDAALVAPELPPVDRSDPENTATYAYVPYCTGDVHWGDATHDYEGGTVHHRGASNMRAFLEALRATRPLTERVFLIGVSAGGYGVTLHWSTAKEVFPSAEVHVLADAAPLVPPQGDRWALMNERWAPVFPPGCVSCATEMGELIDHLAATYPESRHGLLTYEDDGVISSYFGYGPGELAPATASLLALHHDVHPNTKYFVSPGTDHGMLGDSITGPGGVTVDAFVQAWLVGSPSWQSVSVP
jgi:hypothetical protein